MLKSNPTVPHHPAPHSTRKPLDNVTWCRSNEGLGNGAPSDRRRETAAGTDPPYGCRSQSARQLTVMVLMTAGTSAHRFDTMSGMVTYQTASRPLPLSITAIQSRSFVTFNLLVFT